MKLDVYGPSLPPPFGDAQSEHGSNLNCGSDHHSDISEQPEQVCSSRAKKHSDKRKHNMFLSCHPQRRISPLLARKGLLSPLGPLLN